MVFDLRKAASRSGIFIRKVAHAATILISCVFLTVAISSGTVKAESLSADVSATLEKGFARIVFTFKDRTLLPQYVSKMNNGVLVIQFADTVDVAIDRIPDLLPRYVNVARRDTDGRAVRFAIVRQVRANIMEAGERLFVDLLPATWTGAPPGLPEAVIAELAKRADAAIKAQREAEKLRFGQKMTPKVDFRVGQSPTFTRFSFGWNVPFDTQMAREGDTVTLTFNRLSTIDLAPALTDPPPTLKEIFATEEAGKLKVVMAVSPEADVRGFRDDQTYVVDLSRPRKAAHDGEAVARKAVAEVKGEVSASATNRVYAPGAPVSAPEPAPLAKQQAAAPPRETMDMVKAPVEPDRGATSQPNVTSSHAADAHAEAAEPVADLSTIGDDGAESAVPVARGTPVVRVEAKRIGNIVRIAFPFPTKISSAAFKREDALWVVFDSRIPLDIRSVSAALGTSARSVTVEPSGDGQAMRIELGQPLLTTMGADGNSWILSIGELVLEPARPLQLAKTTRAGRGAILIAMPDPGRIHEISDKSIGDKITVVTAFGPARGLLKGYSFAELGTLPSAHGIAIVPKIDDIQVSVDSSTVTLTREPGLTLTTGAVPPPELRLPRSERKQARQNITGDTFAPFDNATFMETSRQLIEAVAAAPEPRKNDARFDLARFYIAHRFAPEALGVLRLIAAVEPGIERDPGFIILYAAGQTMAGRTEPARRALARSEVEDDSDAALWRTVAAAAQQQWDEALAASRKGLAAAEHYPPDVRALFGLSAAEAAVELNDFVTAQSRLAEVLPEDIENDLRARYEILEGRVIDAAGRSDDALARYERASATGDRRAAAEAEYRRLRLLVRDDKLDKDEAIERLKSLAFGWRGDETELKTLRFLANLQVDMGQYRDAFQSMRAALTVDPNAETARLLQDEMSREFVSLYLDGKADALPPVEALTLYYDFRELTPIGRLGDDIVRKLADRLVGVDLLDPAAELLSHQIDNRLRGTARALVAADLAVIHLIDRKPERALAVLNKTRQSQLPATVERQRRLVEARALSDSGRGDLALEMVSSLSGSDVERLRADTLWKAKRWRDAGERLESMLAGRWNEAAPLDDQERSDVIRAAVAYALANDQLALDRFRSKFAKSMQASTNAAIFDVVTSPIQSQGEDFRDIAKSIATVDTMQNFLEEYRAQYMKTPPRQMAEPEIGKQSEPAKAPDASNTKPSTDAGKKPEAAAKTSDATKADQSEAKTKVASADPAKAQTVQKRVGAN